VENHEEMSKSLEFKTRNQLLDIAKDEWEKISNFNILNFYKIIFSNENQIKILK